MRIKKYPQSHLVISNGVSKIVIDPGNGTFKSGIKPSEFSDARVFLITHSHADHMDPDNIKQTVDGKLVFANQDVADKLKPLGITVMVVHDQQVFEADSFKVKAIELPHCKMQDGTDGPPNLGFLIDGVLFHPGDGDKAPGITAPNVALPIAGPTITLEGALEFATNVQAKVVIPIHNDFFHNDPEKFKTMAQVKGIEVRILNSGQETEI